MGMCERLSSLLANTKVCGKNEIAAYTRFAFNMDVATHQFNELLGNRKTQTGAAILAGC